MRKITHSSLAAMLLLSLHCTGAAAQTPALSRFPVVIGHRGASGYLPEHTIPAYELAIEQGVDFIEPDLVSTKDGVLMARHENEISGTTNVAIRFPGRKTHKMVDGRKIEGWFIEDFTYAEIKTIRARQRLPFRDQSKNDLYRIPTFQDVIDVAKRQSRKKGRIIGIYPETKHPTYFRSIGLPLEEPLVKILKENGYDNGSAPVFIQSFEVKNLKSLNKMTEVRLVQLIDEPDWKPYDFTVSGDRRTYGDMITPAGLAKIAAYADGIGPWKRLIVPLAPDKTLMPPTKLVQEAHTAGLLVHLYTFRNEPRYLAAGYKGKPAAEYHQFFNLGIDGVFSDFPDTAVNARDSYFKKP